MSSLLRPAVSLLLVMTLMTGIAYPIAITGVAKLVFPEAAGGSLILRNGKPVGSRLIGQSFTEPRYFWSRPSATAERPYNALASGGSNRGPLNPALVDGVRERIAALRSIDPGNSRPVPVDLVTTSGSGLDPHISVAAFDYQLPRVARARNMPEDEIRRIAAPFIEGPILGFLGEPRVNVVELNLALDAR